MSLPKITNLLSRTTYKVITGTKNSVPYILAVIYFKKDNESEVSVKSLCFLSDDLEHDVVLVHKVLSDTVSYIKENVNKNVKLIHYFSDGCAGQYKNCKHFLNLCHHVSDFGISCEWNFFATSHGKSPCDGIGGTVKRLAAKASLQRPIHNQILSAVKMLEFCSSEINGIDFIFIESTEMDIKRKDMKQRLSNATTVF